MSTDSWIGHAVGDYRLVELIGTDLSGVSYRAAQLSRDRTVALKLISGELASRESFRERFFGETELLKSIHHPHLVTTYEAGEDAEGTVYVATRYLPATDLDALTGERDPISYLSAVEIISQVAEGLDYAHTEGLVHRGLSPRSILVLPTEQGDHAYLGDFGITEDTVPFGGLLGTPDDGSRPGFHYVSPEQINGEPADARSDVYGLACVLFEAIAGESPFAEYSGVDQLEAHLSVPPPSIAGMSPEVPDLDEIFATALAKDPDERFDSVLEMARALPTKRRVLSRWRAMLAAGTMAPGSQVPAGVGALEPAGAGVASASASASEPAEGEIGGAADIAGPAARPAMSTGGSSGGSGDGDGNGDSNGPPDDGESDARSEDEGDDEPGRREAGDEDDAGAEGAWERSSWRGPAVAAGLLAVGAVVVGALALGGAFDDDESEQRASSDSVTVEGPPVDAEAADGGSAQDAAADDEKDEARKPEDRPAKDKKKGAGGQGGQGGGQGEVGSWPSGTTGYTAVAFASTSDQAGAQAAASEAAALGFRSGVLNSSDYGSLQPGSYVAFAGIYETSEEAEDAVAQLQEAGVASAPYVRFIG